MTGVQTCALPISVFERALAGIVRIGTANPDATVAAVSHDLPIRALVATLGRGGDEAFWTFPLPNCGTVTLELGADGVLAIAK